MNPSRPRLEFSGWSLLRAALILMGGVAAVAIARSIATVLWWVAIAAVIAAMLYPAQQRLARLLPRAVALTLVVIVVTAGSAAIVARGYTELVGQIDEARTSAVAMAHDVEDSPSFGAIARQLDLAGRADQLVRPEALTGADSASSLQQVASSGSALTAISMLAILLVVFGPSLLEGAVGQIDHGTVRRRLWRYLLRSYDRCARYGWMMVARAAVYGALTYAIATITGSSSPTVLALWVAVLSVIPAFGLVLAAVPAIAIVALRSPLAAAALAAVIIAVQAVDARVVMRRVEARSMRIGALVTLLAVTTGWQLDGIGGVIVALAFAGFAVVFVAELLEGNRDLPTATHELTPDATPRGPVLRPGATGPFELGWRTPLLFTLAAIGVAGVAGLALSGPAWLLAGVGIVFAFAFDPVVSRIERRAHLHRGVAVAVLAVSFAAIAITLVALFAPATVEQAQHLPQDAPHVVDDLTTVPVVGPLLADNHIPDRARTWVEQAPQSLSDDPSALTGVATSGLAAIGAALLAALFCLGALVDGPWLVGTMAQLPPAHRLDLFTRAGHLVTRTVGRYFSGSLLLSGLQSLQVLITGLALGVPLTPALALWAGVWNLVPQVGGAIGGSVFVLVAFTQGARVGVIAGVVFLVYLVISNNVLLPLIVGKATDLSPVSTMVATIAGFTLAGILGAMLAVPVLAAGKAIANELRPESSDPPPPRTRRRRLHRGRVPGTRSSRAPRTSAPVSLPT